MRRFREIYAPPNFSRKFLLGLFREMYTGAVFVEFILRTHWIIRYIYFSLVVFFRWFIISLCVELASDVDDLNNNYYVRNSKRLNYLYRIQSHETDGSQLIIKLPASYGTRRFVTVFTTAHYISLSWTRLIHSTSTHPISLIPIILYPHLHLGLPSGLLTSHFPIKMYFSSPRTCYTPCPTYAPWFRPLCVPTWWTLKIMKILTVRFENEYGEVWVFNGTLCWWHGFCGAVVVSVKTHVRPSDEMGDTKYRRICDSKQNINKHPMFTKHSCSSKAWRIPQISTAGTLYKVDKQCTYHVTLRRVRLTIVAVEKQ